MAAAVLSSLALLSAGCGGGDEPSGTAPGPSPAPGAPAGEPQRGGSLLYGVEADSDGFDPTANRWAISGTMVGLAVFDPLAVFDDQGEPQPYLASSIEPNDDHTVWTITLRPGIEFHDSTPLNAAAVVRTMEGHLASGLTRPAIAPIESVEAVDDLTVEVNMNQPWVAFPALLTAQVGVVPSPTMLDAEAGARNPVGTGPFVFESWNEGDNWRGVRNENYWREGLPYLDDVEFRVIPDSDSLVQALQASGVDIMHTSDPDTIVTMQNDAENDRYQVEVTDGEGEESFVMLNLDVAPFDDLRVRQALAMATDRQRYVDLTAAGLPAVADSLVTPEHPWYVDTDYPEYDLVGARALVDGYEAENGPISFELATTTSQANQRSISQLADMWADAGIEATQAQYEQNTFIVNALGGLYEANLWRQFGAVDVDSDAHWWRSDSTLNFANLDDEQVDEALRRGRSSPDEADRAEAYGELQRRFNELLPYIWLHHSTWGVGYQNNVHGITATVPDDPERTIPLGGNFTAVHLLTEVWKSS